MPDYRVLIPDLSFYQQTVACQFACPVCTDGRAYVNAIARGEYERVYLIARETNPFASTCGSVCGAPCEAACRRGKIDAPIAIRALKRFVNDRYGVYLGETGKPRQPPAWPGYVGSTDAFDLGNTSFPTSRSGLSPPTEEMAQPPTCRRHRFRAGRPLVRTRLGPAQPRGHHLRSVSSKTRGYVSVFFSSKEVMFIERTNSRSMQSAPS